MTTILNAFTFTLHSFINSTTKCTFNMLPVICSSLFVLIVVFCTMHQHVVNILTIVSNTASHASAARAAAACKISCFLPVQCVFQYRIWPRQQLLPH